MNVKEFQKKLADLMIFAMENQKQLSSAQVTGFFDEALEKQQLTLIYQYLKSQGVTIEDILLEDNVEAANTEKTDVIEEKADPLSSEEEVYLKHYLESMKGKEEKDGEREKLFLENAEGNPKALQRLTEIYLPVVVELCKEHHRETLFIGDMIQEVNLNLYLSLGKGLLFNDSKIRQLILGYIHEALQEKEQELFQDEYLVTKVRNLEAAVKELTDDGEEDEKKFSVEELSILLDMTVEEIQDILRLTGDDK